MTFLEAYAICTTVLACLLAMKVFREPKDPTPAFAKVMGQTLFLFALVGLCSLAARGLVEIVGAVA